VIEIRMPKLAPSAGDNARSGNRVEDLGIRVGCAVEMLNNSGSPVLLKVGESRVAVDRGLAMKIMVREVGR